MIPKELVPVYHSEVIRHDLFTDAFGISENGIDAIVAHLKQECPGRQVTNGDVELVLLQFYAQDEEPGQDVDRTEGAYDGSQGS
jgi:hypothetical protein